MLRNIFTVSSGTAAAQIIMLLATPILTRRYEMKAFGHLAAVTATVSILSAIGCLRYESAILINKRRGDAEAGLVLCVCLLMVVCLTLFILNQFLRNMLPLDLLASGSLSMLPVLFCVFVTTLGMILTNWHLRHERYWAVCAAVPIRALGIVITQYMVYSVFKTTGLIFGYMAGHAIYCALLCVYLLLLDCAKIYHATSVAGIRRVLREHRNFPLFGVWASIVNRLAGNLPNLLFVKMYSPVLAGAYSMSNRLVRAPLAVVGQSIFSVVAQSVGQHACDRDQINRLVTATFTRMAHIGGLPFVVLAVMVHSIVVVILGQSWGPAGTYCRYLSPWLFLIYLTWPLTAVYNTLNQQRMLLFFNVMFLLAVLAAFASAFLGCSSTTVVILLSALGSLSRLSYSYWILRLLDKERFLRTLTPAVLYFMLIALVACLPILTRFSGKGL